MKLPFTMIKRKKLVANGGGYILDIPNSSFMSHCIKKNSLWLHPTELQTGLSIGYFHYDSKRVFELLLQESMSTL